MYIIQGYEKIEFTVLPKILLLQLKRFNYDITTCSTNKIKQNIINKEKIKLNYYDIIVIYELCQLIVHVGETIDSGHYISYVKVNILQ